MPSGVLLSGKVGFDLQGTLSAGNPPPLDSVVVPHHPISCRGELEYDDDGFRCAHASVPADEERTVFCVQQSIAVLLMELAFQTL